LVTVRVHGERTAEDWVKRFRGSPERFEGPLRKTVLTRSNVARSPPSRSEWTKKGLQKGKTAGAAYKSVGQLQNLPRADAEKSVWGTILGPQTGTGMKSPTMR